VESFDDLKRLGEWSAATEMSFGEFLVEDDVCVEPEFFMSVA
jgi:hypothetical protein